MKIGSMYRCEESWGLFTEPYQGIGERDRASVRIGLCEKGDVCQLIETHNGKGVFAVRLLCGLQLGWISFFKQEHAKEYFTEVVDEEESL